MSAEMSDLKDVTNKMAAVNVGGQKADVQRSAHGVRRASPRSPEQPACLCSASLLT